MAQGLSASLTDQCGSGRREAQNRIQSNFPGVRTFNEGHWESVGVHGVRELLVSARTQADSRNRHHA